MKENVLFLKGIEKNPDFSLKLLTLEKLFITDSTPY